MGLTCNHRRPCKLEARETDYGGEGVLSEWHEDGVTSPGMQVTSPFSTEEARTWILPRTHRKNQPRQRLVFCLLKRILDFGPQNGKQIILCRAKPSAL